MPQVTGATAARVQAIEDTNIVAARIEGDDIIFTTGDGTDINIGSLRGPAGPTGPQGPNVPTATIVAYAADETPPTGFLDCDGSDVSRTTYADLFAKIGTLYGEGDGSTTFGLPDGRGRFIAAQGSASWAQTIGATGGSSDAVLPLHDHGLNGHSHGQRAHAHVITHGHTASSANDTHSHTTSSAGNHRHASNSRSSTQLYESGTGSYVNAGSYGTAMYTAYAGTHAHTVSSDTHKHTITVNAYSGTSAEDGATTTDAGGSGLTQTRGSDPADANLPPYLIVGRCMIKT